MSGLTKAEKFRAQIDQRKQEQKEAFKLEEINRNRLIKVELERLKQEAQIVLKSVLPET